jgi:hypothetical protein
MDKECTWCGKYFDDGSFFGGGESFCSLKCADAFKRKGYEIKDKESNLAGCAWLVVGVIIIAALMGKSNNKNSDESNKDTNKNRIYHSEKSFEDTSSYPKSYQNSNPTRTFSPPQSLNDFLYSWFKSTSSNNVDFVINHYADEVDFCYNTGVTSKNKLRQEQLQFNKKFPNRTYSDWNVKNIQPDSSGNVTINYSFRYFYKGTKNASGISNVSITVRQINGEWKIARFYEKVSSF